MSDMETYRNYASKVHIFHSLQPEEVGHIINKGDVVPYARGQTIFHEGQIGNSIFIVFSGKVGVYQHQKLIARCHVGDAFGVMSALTHEPHSGTASALTSTNIFILHEKDLNAVLEKRVAIRLLLNVVHVLSKRLHDANHRNLKLSDRLNELLKKQDRTAPSV
jgi:CRP-like cAMP-binding protein